MPIDDKIRYVKVQYDINKEQQKYQHYHPVKLIYMNFFYIWIFSIRKTFEKQTKAIEEQENKEENKRLVALTNKNDHKDNCKEIFEELVKGRFDEIKELTNEINRNDLTF